MILKLSLFLIMLKKIYTMEYFENLGHKAAKELAVFMRECLSEIDEE